MKVAVVSCSVLEDLIREGLSEEVQAVFLDVGLHEKPQKMPPAIEDALNQIAEPSLVLMGYGLCGNGLAGVRAGRHTLVIPRSADCISILLGSYSTYQKEVAQEPGTIYVSKGWIECGGEPLAEYKKYAEKYGEETARWLIDEQYEHYRRLCFIASRPGDFEKYGDYARKVAEFAGLDYEEKIGTREYVDSLLAQRSGPKPGEDFVIVRPGETIEQSSFFR